MILQIKVKTQSGKQEITKISENEYKVSLKSPPENNEANLELIKILKKHFKAKEVKIIFGRTSRRKRVELQ